MASACESRTSDLGQSPAQGHCVVFLDKTLHSESHGKIIVRVT